MKTLRQFLNLFRRKRLDAEMSEEMRHHLEEQTLRNVQAGMPPEQARHAAQRQFGNLGGLQQEAREGRGWVWLEQFRQDLHYAVRVLAKNPGFTGFALLTLGLGIGANTAIFSVVNSVLLRPLPVSQPGELVFLSDPEDRGGVRGGIRTGSRDLMTYAEFQYVREHNTVFAGVAASTLRGGDVVAINPDGTNSHGPAFQSLVSGGYFSVLGVRMVLGRGFDSGMDRVRDANPVAVISHAFWRDRFGEDPSVLGRIIRINDSAFEIIGVAQPGFAGDTVGWPVGVWLPLSMQAKAQPGRDMLTPNANPQANWRWLGVIGRLKPGVDLAQAQAAIEVTYRQFLQSLLDAMPPSQLAAVPAERQRQFFDQHIVLSDGSRGGSTLRKAYSKPLVVLLALVGLLLLSACANLANLTLARAARRQKEIALRVALGAKASRVFRQLLVESLLLSSLGGILGLSVAHWGDTLLFRLVTQNPSAMHTDSRVMFFALGVSVVVGVIFGTAPALQAWRVDLNHVLKGGEEGATRTSPFPLGKALVVLQVGLSLPLLVIAGLFVHSFQKLTTVDLGYDQEHLLMIQPDTAGYKGAALGQFYGDLAERLRVLPGVQGVSRSANGLFTGRETSYRILVPGYEPAPGRSPNPSFDHVGAGYFSIVGIPVLRGREFTVEDAAPAQRVAVINQTMARQFFGETNPLGQTVTVNVSAGLGAAVPCPVVIVGVVADAKYYTVREEPRPFYYLPADNPVGASPGSYLESQYCLVRTTGDPAAVMAAVRVAVAAEAPQAQPPVISTVDQMLGRTLGLDRALTGFSSFFGGLATVLVSIGIYGIMAYAVARRTREIGIRIAIGAGNANVLRLILGESLILVLGGVAIGIPAAIWAGKFVTVYLFGLTPLDPVVLGLATGLMFIVAAAAAFFPARRATRVDPVVALRAE